MITGNARGPDVELTPAISDLFDRIAAQRNGTDTKEIDLSELREHPDIVALVSRARQNEKNPPRKHHVVPASYLRRWTEGRQLRVTEIDAGRSWITTAEKAARRTDYYSLALSEVDPEELPPLLAETMLSEIEALGKDAIDALLGKGVGGLSHQERSNLALFLGFQYVRGESTRQMIRKIVNDSFKLEYGQLSQAGIRRELKKRGLTATPELIEATTLFINGLNEGTVTVGPQNAAEVHQAFQVAEQVAEALYQRPWTVFKTAPILLTCDEPVVPVGRPGENRNERTGLKDARIVIFPLSSDALLVMFQHSLPINALSPLTLNEIAEINHEIMANASRWAFERPNRKTSTALRVPILPEPTQLVEHQVQGKPNSAIIRVFRPSRWAASSYPPPWPALRWP